MTEPVDPRPAMAKPSPEAFDRLTKAFKGSTRNPEHLSFLAGAAMGELMAEAWEEGYDRAMEEVREKLERANNPYRES